MNENCMEISSHIDLHFLKTLKERILQSRYQAAKLVNRELVALYFSVGEALHHKIESENWGAKVLESLSAQLQQELPGLRGFSAGNLRKMRIFYEAWLEDPICPSLTDKLEAIENQHIEGNSQNSEKSKAIGSTLSNKLETPANSIRLPVTDKLEISKNPMREAVMNKLIKQFLSVSFTHHYEMVLRLENPDHRWFYIEKIAAEFWSVRRLRRELQGESHLQQGTLHQQFRGNAPR